MSSDKRLKKKNGRKQSRDRHWRLKSAIRSGMELIVLLLAVAALRYFWPEVSLFVNRTLGRTQALSSEEVLSAGTAYSAPGDIPEYSGEDFAVLQHGVPNFTEYDLTHITGEHYSELDSLGRCGTAWARLDRSMMPEETRGEIGNIRPSGWRTAKYPDLIGDNYLYNRCHLIAYALSGQNDNEKNLITGTRYMNSVSMLSFELQVMRYLDDFNNHVLYRVTPYFKGKELVARGVEMEAYSVEDEGAGLCFHVFVYNIQPGIEIDYRTGNSREAG